MHPLSKTKQVFLAQLVEQLTLNQWVQGSSPWEDTKKEKTSKLDVFFAYYLHISKKNSTFAKNSTIMFTKTPFEYRAQAREILQNRWGEAAIVGAIIMGFSLFCSMPSTLDSIGTLCGIEALESIWWKLIVTPISTVLAMLITPVQYAFAIALLYMTRGNEENLVEGTLQHIKTNYVRLFVAGAVLVIITMIVGIFTLWIGAIVLGYAYRMVPYLLIDYPNITLREAMKVSREMMRGYKWRLFVLDLSFIGWYMVGMMTCGIGMLFVTPYIQTTTALFYDDLKKQRLVETED